MSNHFLHHNSRKESGAVLITGLIFLVVLTMVVLSVLRSGTLEERMAANSRNRQVAIQAAEAVLSDAQEQLFSGAEYKSKFDSINLVAGFYSAPAAGVASKWTTVDWRSSTATLTFTSTESNLYGVASAPRYIVEIISPPTRPNSAVPCSKGLATVTARGVGKDSSTVFVQAMYRYQSDRPSDGC